MNHNDAITQALADAKRSSSGWARMACPFCEAQGHRDRKASFGVSPTGFYSCFRCHAKGRIDGMDLSELQPAPIVEQGPMGAPDGFELLGSDDVWKSESFSGAVDYVVGRGLTRSVVRRVGIGAVLRGQYHHRVVVPVLDAEDNWLGWVGRTWAKQAELPYIYPPGQWRGTTLYNGAALRMDTDEPAMIVEGCFDAIAVWPDGVAVLGKPSEWQVEAMCAAKRPVAVVLDRDAYNEGWALAQLLRLRGVRAGAVRLPPVLDPDEVPIDWLREEARRCIDG